MPASVTVEALASSFRPGERLFLPGSVGEPAAFTAALLSDPERNRGLSITSTAIPGINALALDGLGEGACVTGLFSQPGFGAAGRAGRFRHLPVSYGGMLRHLAECEPFDACILHVAPPDADGRCSLGAAVEFTPAAAARSGRLVAIVNPAMPRVPGAASVAWRDLSRVAESDAPLRTYAGGRESAVTSAIAARVAALVRDGTTLQVGLGKVPDLLFRTLHDRRDLRLHSGMLSDGVMALSASGALAFGHRPTSCVYVGSPELYAWMDGRDDIVVAEARDTHGPAALARLSRFMAVNSALAVDLFGQANLETANGAAVSGVGGAPDFARAARLAPDSLSIVALPATYARGSRIVPRLPDGLASLARTEIDVVVTEHATVDLRGRSVPDRAEALIEAAAPEYRADLHAAWRDTAARL